uniref:CCHC-type domain-containing protein n=1 Tax=Brassica campestris TaxID=3711 RepID=M4FGS4_BRACM
MEYYSEEEDSFDSSQCSDIDETDQAWSSKEDGCERSCSADEYSSSEYGDDPGEESPEPKPPDHSQGNTRFYKKGGCRENKSWSIDTDSEISMGEEDECDSHPTQACNPLKKSLTPASYGVTPYKVPGRSKSTTAQSTPAATKKQSRTERGNTPDYLVFSGSSMDPGVYLRWEDDMKQWLRAKNIPKEDKLSYALDMLIGKAYTWWEQEDAQTYYSNPVLNWGDLKARMYKEFVRKLRASNKVLTRPMYQENRWSSMSTPKARPAADKSHAHCPDPRKSLSTSKKAEEVEKLSPAKKYQGWTSTTSKHHHQATSRKEVSSLKPESASMPMSAHGLKPKKVTSSVPTLHKGAMRSSQTEKFQERPIPTLLMESQGIQEVCQRSKETSNQQENIRSQGKSSNSKNLKDQTCYRCHRRGHFAAVCPSKKLKETSLGEKTEISKISDSLIQSDLLVSNACIMHLSMPKGVNTGPKEHESIEEEPPGEIIEMDPNKAQDIRKHLFLKEINSEDSILPNPTSTTPGSPSLEHRIQKSNGDNISNKWRQNPSPSYTTQKSEPQESEATTECTRVAETTPREGQIHETIPEPIQRRKIKPEPLNFQVRELKDFETGLGTQKKCTAQRQKTPVLILGTSLDLNKRTDSLVPLKLSNSRFMHLSLPKSFDPGIRQGDGRPSHGKRMEENQGQHLTCPQNVEGDARSIKSKQAAKEQNILQLAKTIVLCVRAASHGRPVCADGRPRMSSTDVLCVLTDSHYHPRTSYVCWQTPTDAVIKSVPEPEANQLHQTANPKTHQDMCSIKTAYLTNQEDIVHETKFPALYAQQGVNPNWNHHQRYSDKEDMNFTNRRFSIPSICEYPSLEVVSSPTKKRSDPNQSLDFKEDILAFQQANNGKKSPRKYGVKINFSKPDKPVLHLPYLEAGRFNQLQTRHWRPGETSNHSRDQSKRPGESETFLQCTSIHQIIQNQTRPYLPFLESKAINSQQLFYHQDWHDFYTYFFSKEVPKKLTYSLKPSRYKTRIKSLEESHWNQEILLTASLSVSLFSFCFLSFL